MVGAGAPGTRTRASSRVTCTSALGNIVIRRRTIALVALCALILASGPALRAHEGHDHKIMGTVTMAAADHVMLKDTAGKNVTVLVTKETKVRSKPPMKVADIKAGTRVVITATQEKDQSFKAKAIEVGAAPAAAKP